MSGGWRSLAAEDVTTAAKKAVADLGLIKPVPTDVLYDSVRALIGAALTVEV